MRKAQSPHRHFGETGFKLPLLLDRHPDHLTIVLAGICVSDSHR
jgi:hypothetical protein